PVRAGGSRPCYLHCRPVVVEVRAGRGTARLPRGVNRVTGRWPPAGRRPVARRPGSGDAPLKRTLLLVIPPALALVALGALTQPRSPAADPPAKSGPNVAPPEQAAKAKNRVDADAVSDVALAHALAAYGHRTHSAEALVMAASIMGKYGTTPLGVAATMDRGGRGHRAGEPATSSAGAGAVKPPAMTAKGLL